MSLRKGLTLVLVLFLAAFTATLMVAQETTGGLQGTVKDASGAVVPNANITLKGSTLIGAKSLTTDAGGYYRFANLPPGTYTMTVAAKGFTTLKRSDINIEVGHLPTLDLALKVGAAETVVEVNSEAPVIDVTTTHTMTNVTPDVLADVPHGRSFQSVIQFAPSARNEPLAGNTYGGTGGSMPGSSGNGLNVGFSIGGAADSENAYLVEGQDTENISGGYSKANVPYQFIQEVQVKTSGIEAEHGGALGGVVNVVMKKGGNQFHGQLFTYWEGNSIDANQNNTFLQYDPNASNVGLIDPGTQLYRGKKDSFHDLSPGGTLGGAIIKDRLWFFVGFAPEINSLSRTVDFTPADPTVGVQHFTQDRKQYYGTARLDYAATQKIRLFASWLYQYARETGASIPSADPINTSFTNTSVFSPLAQYSPKIGWSAPNSTYNFGADITLSPRVVSTTRFGYFFDNYHDFGWPTSGVNLVWDTNVDATTTDNAGNPVPSSLFGTAGKTTVPYTGTYTLFNADKHYQFDQDISFFKSGWGGTHNFKFGYQLNHLSNVISQNGNVPQAFLHVG
ncbi:MAG: TonB-dependent receptor, partial [Terriglobia bacterium]|nr:TonB-dependent receptor [Terriglobia bacterium]